MMRSGEVKFVLALLVTRALSVHVSSTQGCSLVYVPKHQDDPLIGGGKPRHETSRHIPRYTSGDFTDAHFRRASVYELRDAIDVAQSIRDDPACFVHVMVVNSKIDKDGPPKLYLVDQRALCLDEETKSLVVEVPTGGEELLPPATLKRYKLPLGKTEAALTPLQGSKWQYSWPLLPNDRLSVKVIIETNHLQTGEPTYRGRIDPLTSTGEADYPLKMLVCLAPSGGDIEVTLVTFDACAWVSGTPDTKEHYTLFTDAGGVGVDKTNNIFGYWLWNKDLETAPQLCLV